MRKGAIDSTLTLYHKKQNKKEMLRASGLNCGQNMTEDVVEVRDSQCNRWRSV